MPPEHSPWTRSDVPMATSSPGTALAPHRVNGGRSHRKHSGEPCPGPPFLGGGEAWRVPGRFCPLDFIYSRNKAVKGNLTKYPRPSSELKAGTHQGDFCPQHLPGRHKRHSLEPTSTPGGCVSLDQLQPHPSLHVPALPEPRSAVWVTGCAPWPVSAEVIEHRGARRAGLFSKAEEY